MSSRINYEDALIKYYDLKHRYEEGVRKNKRKGVTETKCISCKKRGGTVFTNNDNILSAVCGASSPCRLHISILKSITNNIDDLLRIIYNDKNLEEDEILQMKLNYLFGFITEDELTSDFDELKDRYDKTIKTIKTFEDEIDEQTDMDERMHEVRINNIKKNRRNAKLKGLVKEFLATDNYDLLNDIIQLSVKIHKNENMIREEKYMVSNIEYFKDPETKENIVKLFQETNSIQSKEFTQPGKVLHFILK